MNLSSKEDLARFTTAILNAAHKKADAMEQQIISMREKTLSKTHDEAAKDAEQTIRKTRLSVKKSENKRLSAFEMAIKKDIINERNAIIDEVFAEVICRLKAFCQSDAYAAYLSRRCTEALAKCGPGKNSIVVKRGDKVYLAGFADVTETDDPAFLGGVLVENLDRGIVINNSFGELLKEKRATFLFESGLSID